VTTASIENIPIKTGLRIVPKNNVDFTLSAA